MLTQTVIAFNRENKSGVEHVTCNHGTVITVAVDMDWRAEVRVKKAGQEEYKVPVDLPFRFVVLTEDQS